MRQRDIEAIASPLVLARLVELREELSHEAKKRAPSKGVDFDAARVRLGTKRARIVDAYADGAITREDFRARVERVDGDIARLEAEESAAKVRRSPLENAQIRRAVLKEITMLTKAWTAATPTVRREIVKQLSTQCRLVRGEVPTFIWRSAEQLAEPAP